jgi:mannitol-1-phosphate/altronate dehydrogenase
MGGRQFVGFGLGPIQSGLMLFEAQQSGNFGRFTVAEVDQVMVDAIRANDGCLTINVAHRERVQAHTLRDLTVYNPQVAAERAPLGKAIAEADELATAVPSVNLYTTGGDSSIAALLAAHLNPARPQLIYACENNNYAAEILLERIRERCDRSRLGSVQILNTVVGKMSGVIRDPAEIARLNLQPMTPSLQRAVLVEEFNRILVTRVRLPEVTKGIAVFAEKDDLLPFEEAKLFGHNAIHALLGYLAAAEGLVVMSDIRDNQSLLAAGRNAFVDECGEALIRKHGSLGDPLFTPEGWRAYAQDLLERMTNPFLNDAVERICRDPQRKLGYGDRLFGTMRECLKQNVEPRLLARGAHAALRYEIVHERGVNSREPALTTGDVEERLRTLWRGEPDDGLMDTCVSLVAAAGN